MYLLLEILEDLYCILNEKIYISALYRRHKCAVQVQYKYKCAVQVK